LEYRAPQGISGCGVISRPAYEALRSRAANRTPAQKGWAALQSIAATTNTSYTGCTDESGFNKAADSNNHLAGLSYDASGNTSSDGTYSYNWDGESQLKSAGGVSYLYDADGQRRAKVGSKLYWYGAAGEIINESDTTGHTIDDYAYFGGQRLARAVPSGGIPIYYVEDFLGTSRVTTLNTGVVCYDADFYPYGGERQYTNTCAQNYKFEGKERDTETGNDNFGARYYNNRFGRWLSSDWSTIPIAVPYANLTNPQTLNLYSMVVDDPESFADLDGHCNTGAFPTVCPGDDPVTHMSRCICQDPNQQNQQQSAQAKPKPKNQPYDPEPKNPDGTRKPPPVPVPGCPTCGWRWAKDDNPKNERGGRWVPDGELPDGVPAGGASWDTGSRGGPGHWDVDDGRGKRERYGPDGTSMPEDVAHPPGWRPVWKSVREWAGDHEGVIVAVGAVAVIGGAVALAPATGGLSLAVIPALP
jgi:RHS repeat-associated protein